VNVFESVDKELTNELCKLLRQGFKIVCVGTELRSDDRVGLYICDKMLSLNFKNVIKCSYGLENCIEDLINLEKALIIDGLYTDLPPGTIVLANPDELSDDILVSTHSIPHKLVIKLIRSLGGLKEVKILGIRVKSLDIGTSLSPEIKRVADELVNKLLSVLGKSDH